MGRRFQGRTLSGGDHLSLLIEVNGPGGFFCEIARTLVLGKASAELLEGFNAVKAAQAARNATLCPQSRLRHGGATIDPARRNHDDRRRNAFRCAPGLAPMGSANACIGPKSSSSRSS